MSEQDRLLEHNYDGIQEYDNPLPSWWVYLFVGSIVYSVLYVGYYTIGVGPSVIDSYEAEAGAALEAQAALLEGVEITEEILYSKMQDGAAMAGMAQQFGRSCASCHGPDGRGLTCPNLTDDAWLHGGSLVDIYKTIRDGVPGKEMKPWIGELGLGKVLGLAAYVGTLRGKNVPGGRQAEGAHVDYTPPTLSTEKPGDPAGGAPQGEPKKQ